MVNLFPHDAPKCQCFMQSTLDHMRSRATFHQMPMSASWPLRSNNSHKGRRVLFYDMPQRVSQRLEPRLVTRITRRWNQLLRSRYNKLRGGLQSTHKCLIATLGISNLSQQLVSLLKALDFYAGYWHRYTAGTSPQYNHVSGVLPRLYGRCCTYLMSSTRPVNTPVVTDTRIVGRMPE